jgi:hypothetical protein
MFNVPTYPNLEGKIHTEYYEFNIYIPPNSYIEIYSSSGWHLDVGPLEVIRLEFMNGISPTWLGSSHL